MVAKKSKIKKVKQVGEMLIDLIVLIVISLQAYILFCFPGYFLIIKALEKVKNDKLKKWKANDNIKECKWLRW